MLPSLTSFSEQHPRLLVIVGFTIFIYVGYVWVLSPFLGEAPAQNTVSMPVEDVLLTDEEREEIMNRLAPPPGAKILSDEEREQVLNSLAPTDSGS